MVMMALPLNLFSAEGDTLDVPNAYDGSPVNALPNFIKDDTLRTSDRVYRLKRGTLYIIGTRTHITFDLNIVADDDDPQNPVKPPMICRGYNTGTGQIAGDFFVFDSDSLNIKFKNILFQGMEMPSEDYPKGRLVGSWSKPLTLKGEGSKVEIDHCIFNGWGVMGTAAAKDYSLKFTNNIVRNALDYINPWAGMVIDNAGKDCDTLIFVNNTFFNHASYIILTNRNICNYLLFDHNTIYTSIVNPFFMPYLTDADISNNLIYGYLCNGQLPEEIVGGWYDWDSQISSIASISYVDPTMLEDHGLTEADRRVVYKNNAYEWPQEVKDYWASIDTMEATIWMNERTRSMYDNDAEYPLLDEFNNIQAAPGFDPAMETVIVDKMMEFIKTFRKNGESGTEKVDRSYVIDGEYFNVQWPLPENLQYSNSALQTHAEGGFPVGDLNWYPEKKAEWETWITGIEERKAEQGGPSDYVLSQNYPNPFNPTTEISFSIPVSGKTTLTVYNVLGQKVAVLVNEKLAVGSYKYKFDASGLSTGLYFYQLESKDFSQVRKMMLIK
jgi:hypothetical protein